MVSPPSWKATRAMLRQDRVRLVMCLVELGQTGPVWVRFHPSYLCVFLYRVSRYFHVRGRTLSARLVAHMNFFLFGADISPAADLGEGLVVVTPPGTALFGKAGRNLTVMPCSGLGGEIGRREDVGAGAGLPVVGDDVVIGAHGGILGPCRVGDRVEIRPLVVVTQDVEPDMIAEGPRQRVRRRVES